MASRTGTVSFTCRGHPAISGTHAKTLELTRDGEISRRATCVLGIESRHDDRALLALRGEVEVVLVCGEHRDSLTATLTPFFVGDDSLVLRCGAELRGRTLAYEASKGAAGIDRALVAALAHRDAVLEVTVRETGRGEVHGALFVVALPIGNDDDLSPRARRTLDAVDLVLAEDTRRFRDLARRTRLAVGADVVSYHEHNERVRSDEALARLSEGARVALVSDAGTPLCSDPGYVVVRDAVAAGCSVSPVPGPSSSLAVVSVSGLPVDRFTYVGFLPRRAAARQNDLRGLVASATTFVCHEAPTRVDALAADLAVVCPDWNVCVGREVTKIFEEFRRGTARELAAGTLAGGEHRGEFTFVVAPPIAAPAAVNSEQVDVDRIARALLDEGVTPRTIARALAAVPGITHKEAYARVLGLAGDR